MLIWCCCWNTVLYLNFESFRSDFWITKKLSSHFSCISIILWVSYTLELFCEVLGKLFGNYRLQAFREIDWGWAGRKRRDRWRETSKRMGEGVDETNQKAALNSHQRRYILERCDLKMNFVRVVCGRWANFRKYEIFRELGRRNIIEIYFFRVKEKNISILQTNTIREL